MTWAKLDDGFWCHLKVQGLQLESIGVWTLALSWCAKHGSDGAIPRKLPRILEWPETAVTELVAEGLWDETATGWEVHDYLDYNPSKAEVDARLGADRDRKRASKTRDRRKRIDGREVSDIPSGKSSAFRPLPDPDPDPDPGSDPESETQRESTAPTADWAVARGWYIDAFNGWVEDRQVDMSPIDTLAWSANRADFERLAAANARGVAALLAKYPGSQIDAKESFRAACREFFDAQRAARRPRFTVRFFADDWDGYWFSATESSKRAAARKVVAA